jgi:hypothetical protein
MQLEEGAHGCKFSSTHWVFPTYNSIQNKFFELAGGSLLISEAHTFWKTIVANIYLP